MSSLCTKSDSIGFIESQMNSIIFKPPQRDYLKRGRFSKPKFIETFRNDDDDYDNKDDSDIIELTYFIIHPNKIRHAHKSQRHKKQKELNSPYLLWNHGNSSDLIESYSTMKAFHSELGGQIGIIMYDYEGYGLSSGQCRETNCYRDLELMVRLCTTRLNIPSDRLFLVGHSLGTGIVVEYVSKQPEWKTPIILLSPYKTISRVMVDPHWTDFVTNLIVKSLDRFTSIDKIANIDCPIIIYHGMKDTLINYRHSVDLRKQNKKRTTLILLKKANHNDLLSHIEPKEIWNIVFNHINKDE